MSETEVSQEAEVTNEVSAIDPLTQAATDAFGALRVALKDYTMGANIEDASGLSQMIRGAGFASAIFAIERVWVAGGSVGGKIPTPGSKGGGGAKRGRKSNAEKAAQEAADAAAAAASYEVSGEGVGEAVEGSEGQVEMEATNNGRGRGRRNA